MSLPVARCPLPLPLFTKPLLSGASCLVIVIIVILSSRCSFPLPNGYPPVCAVLGSRCRISFIDATSLPLQLQLQPRSDCDSASQKEIAQANRQTGKTDTFILLLLLLFGLGAVTLWLFVWTHPQSTSIRTIGRCHLQIWRIYSSRICAGHKRKTRYKNALSSFLDRLLAGRD